MLTIDCLNARMLDLSFNLLRAIPDGLEHLQSLDTIYFVQNKISKITGLNNSATLRSLELGGNRLRVRLYFVRFWEKSRYNLLLLEN
jgi:hypothetical protein